MSTERKPLTWRGRLIVGLCFVAMGTPPLLSTFNIGPLGVEDINGPAWMGLAAGGVFVVAGLAIMLGDKHPIVNSFLAAVIMAGLAALGNWIAFGIGARVCGGSMLFWHNDSLSGLGCRLPFGIGAIVANGMVLLMVIGALQKALGGPPNLARLRRLAENLLLLCLAPVLLPLILLLLGRAGIDIIKTRWNTGNWPRNEAFIGRREAGKSKVRKEQQRP